MLLSRFPSFKDVGMGADAQCWVMESVGKRT